MQSQWVSGTSVIGCARQANFQIRRRLKADSLAVNNGLRIQRLSILAHQPGGSVHELISRVLPQKTLQPHGAKKSEKTGKTKRRNPADAEHSQRLRIVA